jgi:hypothetical protein
MEPITWSVVAGLLLKYGPEITDFIVRKWNARGVVTMAEWDDVFALAQKSAVSQFQDAIARAGLSLENEHVRNVLALLPKA